MADSTASCPYRCTDGTVRPRDGASALAYPVPCPDHGYPGLLTPVARKAASARDATDSLAEAHRAEGPLPVLLAQMAIMTGLPPATLRGLMAGRTRIRPREALGLERATGMSAVSWLRCQELHDGLLAQEAGDSARRAG